MFSSKNRVKFSKIQIFQKTFSLFQGDRHYIFKFLRKQYWFLHRYSQNLQKTLRKGHRTDLMQLTLIRVLSPALAGTRLAYRADKKSHLRVYTRDMFLRRLLWGSEDKIFLVTFGSASLYKTTCL